MTNNNKLNSPNWNFKKDEFSALGYSPAKAHFDDHLYLILINVKGLTLIKIGRTFFSLKERFAEEDLQILQTLGMWTGTHKTVYDVEQSVLKTFEKHKYQGKLFFPGSTECFELTLPVEKIIQLINDKLREENKAEQTPEGGFVSVSAEQLHVPLLDMSVFTSFVLELNKQGLCIEATDILRSFYSFCFGIMFLSVLAHVAEENGIAKKDIARRSSYRRVNSLMIGRAFLIKAFYSEQENVKDALEKRASKRDLQELYEFLIELSHNQAFSDDSRTQKISSIVQTWLIWHPNRILPGVNPQTINVDKAFELTTNALTQANTQLTELYIAEYFDVSPNVMIYHCSELLYPTAFEEDFERELVLVQELGCC